MNQKRTIGLHIEGVPGTKEVLVAANYGIAAFNIGYSPTIESYARKIAHGDLSWDTSISGKQSFENTFSVDVHKAASVTTPPRYFEALRCCAMLQTVHSGGVSVTTDAGCDNVSCTIEVCERQEGAIPKQLVVTARGCMGDAKVVCDTIGQPVRIDFSFKGVLDGITTRAYADIITPSSFDAFAPDATLAATILLFGTVQYLGKFAINLNNKIELFTDPSKSEGYDCARVVERHPTLEIDPDMLVTDDYNWLTPQKANTTGALSADIGSNLTLSAPAAQPVDTYKPGDREGHITNTIRCELQRSSGNDEFRLLQGSAA